MIQITAYLRNEEDYIKWKSVKNKTEFLHNALADSGYDSGYTLQDFKEGKPQQDLKKLAGVSDVFRGSSRNFVPVEPFRPSAPDPELGYPCCQKKVPCKHWAFDGLAGVWKNELTGKTKEI